MSDACICFLAIYALRTSGSMVALVTPSPVNGPSSVLASHRVLPSLVGCGISTAAPLMRCVSDGDPATFHREPEDEVSVLRYATACREIQGAKSSAHSVLPIKPYYSMSSANASGNQSSTLPLQHPSLQIQLERGMRSRSALLQ